MSKWKTHSPAEESPRGSRCEHSVYCSPQLLICCFSHVMRGYPHMNREKDPLINTAAGFSHTSLPIIDPGTISSTRFSLFLAQSRPVFVRHLCLSHFSFFFFPLIAWFHQQPATSPPPPTTNQNSQVQNTFTPTQNQQNKTKRKTMKWSQQVSGWYIYSIYIIHN